MHPCRCHRSRHRLLEQPRSLPGTSDQLRIDIAVVMLVLVIRVKLVIQPN